MCECSFVSTWWSLIAHPENSCVNMIPDNDGKDLVYSPSFLKILCQLPCFPPSQSCRYLWSKTRSFKITDLLSADHKRMIILQKEGRYRYTNSEALPGQAGTISWIQRDGDHQCYGIWGDRQAEIAKDGVWLLCVGRRRPVDSSGKPKCIFQDLVSPCVLICSHCFEKLFAPLDQIFSLLYAFVISSGGSSINIFFFYWS